MILLFIGIFSIVWILLAFRIAIRLDNASNNILISNTISSCISIIAFASDAVTCGNAIQGIEANTTINYSNWHNVILVVNIICLIYVMFFDTQIIKKLYAEFNILEFTEKSSSDVFYAARYYNTIISKYNRSEADAIKKCLNARNQVREREAPKQKNKVYSKSRPINFEQLSDIEHITNILSKKP